MEEHPSQATPIRVLPLPTFYDNGQGLKKKSRQRNQPPPPKPPAKTVPPISRVFRHRTTDFKAHSISFKGSYNESIITVNSPVYNRNANRSFFEQCFEVEKRLGTGSFGEVFQVKSKEDGKSYAVKVSRERFRNNADRRRKLAEVEKHEGLPQHPNVVQFIRAWEEKLQLYIQTELCAMSLKDYADQLGVIKEDTIWSFLLDLTLGLKHLHDFGSVHMDIKPANIFVSKDSVCKLGDFGLVLSLSDVNTSECQEGDSKYLAPEVLQGNFSKSADIFSLGITIFELACDVELPSGGEGWHQLRSGKLPEEFTGDLSNELKAVIVSMIDPVPSNRITVNQLLAHSRLQLLNNERINGHESRVRRMWNMLISRLSAFFVTVFVAFLFLFQNIGGEAAQQTTNKPVSSTPQTVKLIDSENSFLYDKDMSDDDSESVSRKSLRLSPLSNLKRSLEDDWKNIRVSPSPDVPNVHSSVNSEKCSLRTPSLADVSCRLCFDDAVPTSSTANKTHNKSKLSRSYTPQTAKYSSLDEERFHCLVEPRNLLEVFEDVAIATDRG